MKCPCKGCKDRFVGCHSKCDGYASWKAEQDEKREERQKAREQNSLLYTPCRNSSYRKRSLKSIMKGN